LLPDAVEQKNLSLSNEEMPSNVVLLAKAE